MKEGGDIDVSLAQKPRRVIFTRNPCWINVLQVFAVKMGALRAFVRMGWGQNLEPILSLCLGNDAT